MISHITIKGETSADMSSNANDIFSTLKELNFLVASRICVFPLFENNTFKYTAYVRVGEWIDCDAAYYLIRAIKDGKNTRAYISKTQQLWDISETNEADIFHTSGNSMTNKWTTDFNMADSDTDSEYSEYEADMETITNAEVYEPESDLSRYAPDRRL